MYIDLVCQSMYEEATKVYMIHLLGCTILEVKSHVYINVKYMSVMHWATLH